MESVELSGSRFCSRRCVHEPFAVWYNMGVDGMERSDFADVAVQRVPLVGSGRKFGAILPSRCCVVTQE